MLVRRARALPVWGPFSDIITGREGLRSYVVVRGRLDRSVDDLRRMLSPGACVAFAWHLAAALAEVHEQGGAHGALHPGWVGVDIEGRLTVRPALTAAVRSDPDGDATAQATDCIQLASILEALELERLDEPSLSLLMRGVARDRSRLRLQPGRAVRQSLTYILHRHKDWEASLVETLGDDWHTNLLPRAVAPLPDATARHPWIEQGTRIPRVGSSGGASTATVDVLAAGRPLSSGEPAASVAVQVARAEAPSVRAGRAGEPSSSTGVRVKVRKAPASVRPAPSVPARVAVQPTVAAVAVTSSGLRTSEPSPVSSSAARSVPAPASLSVPASIVVRPPPEAALPPDGMLSPGAGDGSEDPAPSMGSEETPSSEEMGLPVDAGTVEDASDATASEAPEGSLGANASGAAGGDVGVSEEDAEDADHTPSDDAEDVEAAPLAEAEAGAGAGAEAEAEAGAEAAAAAAAEAAAEDIAPSEESEVAEDVALSEESEVAEVAEDASQPALEEPQDGDLVSVAAPEEVADGSSSPSVDALPDVEASESDADAATAVSETEADSAAALEGAAGADAAAMVGPTSDSEFGGEEPDLPLPDGSGPEEGSDVQGAEADDAPLEVQESEPMNAEAGPSFEEDPAAESRSEDGFGASSPALASLLADMMPSTPIPDVEPLEGAAEEPESVDEVFEDDEKTAVPKVPEPVRQALARLDAGRNIREESKPSPPPTLDVSAPLPSSRPVTLPPAPQPPVPEPYHPPAVSTEDAPLWAGLKGVTGDASREDELGSGKWEEEARPLSDFRREMSQEPVREMEDIDPSRGSKPMLYVAVAALIALIVMWYFTRPPE